MATQSQEASPSPTDDGALRANVKTCEVCSWTSTRASEFAYLYKLIGEFRNVICAADAKRVSGKSSLRELQWLQTRAPSHTLPCIVRAHGRPCRTQEGYTRQYKCVEMVKFLDLLPQTFSWGLSLVSSISTRCSPRSTRKLHTAYWHIAATPTRRTWKVISEDSVGSFFHTAPSEVCRYLDKKPCTSRRH